MGTSQHSHLWPGVPYALGAAILFGVSTPLSKLLLGTINPWLLAGLMYLGAGVGLLLLRRTKLWVGEASLKAADYPWLIAVILIGGVAGPLLLMFGLKLTTASSAALLLNLEGLFTMVLAWMVFGENVDRRLLLGAFAILCGAVVLAWDGTSFSFGSGGLFIVMACFAWGVDNNLTRKLSASDPVQIASYKCAVAGLVNVVLAFSLGSDIPSFNLVLAASLVGFFSIGVSLVFFMLALRHVGTARTGAYFSLAPFVGAIVAIVFLQEHPSVQLVAAGALMAIGLLIHLLEKHEHDHDHVELTHDHIHSHDAHHQHAHDDEILEPHSHSHEHKPMRHKHPHFPDLHHHHSH